MSIVCSLMSSFCRILSSIQQFLSGLGDFWTNVLKERDVLEELFVAVSKKHDFDSFRQLCQIEYSPIGSNNKVKEDDSIYA